MLGYIQIYKPELKVREYDVYQGYYCGICKYIGNNFGQLPRIALSYDAAFLALLLASVSERADKLRHEHCLVHPIQKRAVITNDAIAYSSDIMLILAWYKLLDDVNDDNSIKAKSTMLLVRKHFKKVSHKHPGLCNEISRKLNELNELERSKCESIDQVCEPFALIMRIIFSHGIKLLYKNNMNEKDYNNLHQTFANIGYHIGKWIYLMDAVDDIAENIQTSTYNPLLYRFRYQSSEPYDEFFERIKDNVSFNLFHYLSVISNDIDELDIKKNKGILDNIIYFGLNRKTEEILSGKKAGENSDDKEENVNESI